MSKPKIAVDICPICNQQIDVTVTMIEPFLLLKKVDQICFVCYCVPKMWYVVDGELKRHESFNSSTVNSVEEMMTDGFNQKEAKTSIKAVIAFWKKHKK